MSTETSIKVGDRVAITPNGKQGTVTWTDGDSLGVQLDAAPDAWQRPVLTSPGVVRLVAKASYTDVKPAEHWKITALREAWKPVFLDDLENSADEDYEDAAEGRLARAVLAVIELVKELQAELERRSELPTDTVPAWQLDAMRGHRDRLEAEVERLERFAKREGEHVNSAEADLIRWRSATGCDTPELAERHEESLRAECQDWQSQHHNVWNRLLAENAEVARLRRELDEARATTVKPPETDDGEVMTARWQRERAEAAEAASSRLVEAMDGLADEFAEYSVNCNFTRSASATYGVASDRIRAAVKAATETGCNG